jgi:hypothetical protein
MRPRPVAAAGMGDYVPARARGVGDGRLRGEETASGGGSDRQLRTCSSARCKAPGSRGWVATRGRDRVRRAAVAAGMSGYTPARG